MKKLATLIVVLLVVHFGLLFVRPRSAEPAPAADALRLGIVFDVGGRGDKSFNDGAYLGAMRAKSDFGATIRYIEPADASDRESGLRLLSSENMDLVTAVGFIFTDDVNTLAKEYPAARFADIDYAVATDAQGKIIPPPPNVAALSFRENEGSFLVGAIAGLVTKTKTVGFVGGMNIPLIHKFDAGFQAGVRQVCPKCRILAQYAGVTPDAFRNPGKGKEIALSQYQQGADIIYHASGATGLGVFEAARSAGKLAIGVDADQYGEAPGFILTSMIKRVDVALYETARSVKDGKFSGGVHVFGLAEDGVGYVYDEHNKALIPDSVIARVEGLKKEVIAGRIVVPVTPPK
jgi:basic membrane protein A and related proteins